MKVVVEGNKVEVETHKARIEVFETSNKVLIYLYTKEGVETEIDDEDDCTKVVLI